MLPLPRCLSQKVISFKIPLPGSSIFLLFSDKFLFFFNFIYINLVGFKIGFMDLMVLIHCLPPGFVRILEILELRLHVAFL